MSIQSEITLLQNTKKNLKSAIMEKGVTVYPSDIFSTYPTRISQISMTTGDKDNLFSELIDRSITSFVIPNGTSSIRSFCFSDCLSLTSVTIPNTVTTIGSNSFTKTGLTSVTIPESVTFIGKLAFFLSNSLTSITCLSETPPALGNYNNAFDNTNNCPIYVPADSVDVYKTAWPAYASRIQSIPVDYTLFNSIVDRSVTSIDIPNDVTTLGDYVFRGCESLTSVTIPNSVTSVGNAPFFDCTSLTSVTIGSGLTTIGSYMFRGCTSLTGITIPSTVTSIGNDAFTISGLTSIVIPNSVTSLGNSVFQNCTDLTSITIPSNVTSIGASAFNGCSSLTGITVLATTPAKLGYNAFYNTNNCPIYVPSNKVTTYKKASGWSTYASRIQRIP